MYLVLPGACETLQSGVQVLGFPQGRQKTPTQPKTNKQQTLSYLPVLFAFSHQPLNIPSAKIPLCVGKHQAQYGDA